MEQKGDEMSEKKEDLNHKLYKFKRGERGKI